MNDLNKKFINKLPIKTDRLILRQTTTDDVDLILKLDKQEQTQEHLGGVKYKTRKERIEFLKKKEAKNKSGIISSLTVCLNDETPIGFCGIRINEEDNCGELSYIIDQDYCNKGYCTEASEKLISIAFEELNLDYIFAHTVVDNLRSQKVLEKLGFKKINKLSIENDQFEYYRKDKKED